MSTDLSAIHKSAFCYAFNSGDLTKRVVWSLIIEIIIFLITVILAMVDSSAWPETFFWVTMISVVVLNSELSLRCAWLILLKLFSSTDKWLEEFSKTPPTAWPLSCHQNTPEQLCWARTSVAPSLPSSASCPAPSGLPCARRQFTTLSRRCSWFFCASTPTSRCRWTSFSATTRWWVRSSRRKHDARESMSTHVRLTGPSSSNHSFSCSTYFSSFSWLLPCFQVFTRTSSSWAKESFWGLCHLICSQRSHASSPSTCLPCWGVWRRHGWNGWVARVF